MPLWNITPPYSRIEPIQTFCKTAHLLHSPPCLRPRICLPARCQLPQNRDKRRSTLQGILLASRDLEKSPNQRQRSLFVLSGSPRTSTSGLLENQLKRRFFSANFKPKELPGGTTISLTLKDMPSIANPTPASSNWLLSIRQRTLGSGARSLVIHYAE